MRKLQLTIAFLAAVIVATVGLSAVSTQSVISNLSDMGFAPTFSEQMSMYVDDLAGLAPAAGGVNLLGLLVAFGIAALIIRFVWRKAMLGYTLAGLVAMTAEMELMSIAYNDITPIAGARTSAGMIAIALVGLVAGFVFARLKPS